MKDVMEHKITGIALLAVIILVGGVTAVASVGFDSIGLVPMAVAAETTTTSNNANLFVSSERTNNSMGSLQVVEVLILDDDDDDDLRSTPDVTINGDALLMTRTFDGNHYAYFADYDNVVDAIADASNVGLNFGNLDCIITNPDAQGITCGADQNVLKSPKSTATTSTQNWPFIQLYRLSDSIEIQYNRAGGTQTAAITFDDDNNDTNAEMILDRTTYPAGADIHALIIDNRLNIDPTTPDVWTWDVAAAAAATAGTSSMYYGLDAVSPLNDHTVSRTVVNSDLVCGSCSIDIDFDPQNTGTPVINTVSGILDRPNLPENYKRGDEVWVSLKEISGPNTGVFSTTDLNRNSVIQIAPDAKRGTSATINYDDDTPISILVQHSTATIHLDLPTDEWTSGLSVPVIVNDADANRNSLANEVLDTSDVDAIIPTLVTGDPFTLGEISNNLNVWTVYPIDSSREFNRLLATYNDPETGSRLLLNYTDSDDGPFRLAGVTLDDDGILVDATPYTLRDNFVAFPNPGIVEPFSHRAIVNFNTEFDAAALTSFRALTPSTHPLEGVYYVIVDLDENGLQQIRDSLINNADDGSYGFNLINYNFEAFPIAPVRFSVLVDETVKAAIHLDGASGYAFIDDDVVSTLFTDRQDLQDHDDTVRLRIAFDVSRDGTPIGGVDLANTNPLGPIFVDFFSFGFKNGGDASSDRVANQIVRLELEESTDSQGIFTGTLEYTMVNQLNILDSDTYAGLSPTSDEASFVVVEDLTGSSAPRVTYLDLGADGAHTQVSVQEDAPSHSGIISLDVETFKAADTVTVTLDDLDLNVDSELVDIYTVVKNIHDVLGWSDVNVDAVGSGERSKEHGTSVTLDDGSELGRLLDVTFDDQRWHNHLTNLGCLDMLADKGIHTGLGSTGFSLVETGTTSGMFVGTFKIPAEFCRDNDDTPVSVTGLDIAVNYVDYRDASGETTEVSADAGIKASTGSVTLDRTVYPVPFGGVDDFDDNSGSIPASGSSSERRSVFPIHQSGMNNGFDGSDYTLGLDAGEFLSNGDLIVHVRVADSDFDVSASGIDSIAFDGDDSSPVTVSVIRGSTSTVIANIGSMINPITEIAPDAGIFESAITVRFNDGPQDSGCPGSVLPGDDHPRCILQGDVLQVQYNDPTDASGKPNTVTDSATFDLRNGVLQSDKSVYVVGSDMILTLIDPDLNLDGYQNETYDLDLIQWSSSADTVSMGDAGGQPTAFDPEPLSLRETGPDTGIFQIVIEIPDRLDGVALERGEEIELEYTDWGPSGSEYVGDNHEDVRLTVFTSNFGASIELDQKIYTWTDKVYITIVAPDHNFDDKLIDTIGDTREDSVRIATRGYDLDDYRLVETGSDTGIFTGEVLLTGFAHDHDASDDTPIHVAQGPDGNGPTDGLLPTRQDGGITVSYEFSSGETVLTSSLIRWNIGEVQWLEANYPASGINGVLRVIDPDMSLNPEAVDSFEVNVLSDSDAGGISLTVTETGDATGIFEGTVFFTDTGASSGHSLRVAEDDTVIAIYDDATLPDPYTTADSISITATTLIGLTGPPLERAPASDLRVVDAFGNGIDTVTVDEQVQISVNLSHNQDRNQGFAYLVQVQDSDGVTVALSWITGSLLPDQSFNPAVSWIPDETGTYRITAFVWESVDNPTVLSPPVSIDVDVTG